MHFDKKRLNLILIHSVRINSLAQINDLVQNILFLNRNTFGGFFKTNVVKLHSELIMAITNQN